MAHLYITKQAGNMKDRKKKVYEALKFTRVDMLTFFFEETIEIRPTDTESHIFPLLFKLSHIETLFLCVVPRHEVGIYTYLITRTLHDKVLAKEPFFLGLQDCIYGPSVLEVIPVLCRRVCVLKNRKQKRGR